MSWYPPNGLTEGLQSLIIVYIKCRVVRIEVSWKWKGHRCKITKTMTSSRLQKWELTRDPQGSWQIPSKTHWLATDRGDVWTSQDYVHRIGRTGRAGTKGFAVPWISCIRCPKFSRNGKHRYICKVIIVIHNVPQVHIILTTKVRHSFATGIKLFSWAVESQLGSCPRNC